jgi:hypothetical protein
MQIYDHSPLDRVFQAYCVRRGLPYGASTFLFKGQPVDPASTPEQLGIFSGGRDALAVAARGGAGSGQEGLWPAGLLLWTPQPSKSEISPVRARTAAPLPHLLFHQATRSRSRPAARRGARPLRTTSLNLTMTMTMTTTRIRDT